MQNTATRERNIAVVAPEERFRSAITARHSLTAVQTLKTSHVSRWSDIFVLVSIHSLPLVTDVIRVANNSNRLKGIFISVESAAQGDLLPQYLTHIKLRTLRNMLVHSGLEIPNRVLNAFCLGAENELIADAVSMDNDLFVVSCASDGFQIPFNAITALRDASKAVKHAFVVASDGSHLHWPEVDVHLNLESIKSILDPDFRTRRIAERLRVFSTVGESVRRFRIASGLRQMDISGMSERQVRRIENGDRLTVAAARCLATAHHLDPNEYLDQIARLANQGAGKY